jgi:hypothetical protein
LSDRTLDDASFEDWLETSGEEVSAAKNKSVREGSPFNWESGGEVSESESSDREYNEPGEEWKSSYK